MRCSKTQQSTCSRAAQAGEYVFAGMYRSSDHMRHAACYIQRMAEILQQVRFAFRFIRRNPAFAAITVCVLALGIGANSAMFSVVNAVLIRPIPYPDPDRVGIIWEKSESQGWARINPSGPDFLDWKAQSRSFKDMALMEPGSGTLTG